MIFCTLLNQLFLPQGLALYRSLERTARREFLLYVLCIDEYSAAELERLGFPRLRVIRLDELDDDELKAERTKRSIGEFCWTCTAPLLMHVLHFHPRGTVAAYVDADIRFFSDPAAIFDELGDQSIFIHEHDFAPSHAHLRAQSGRFNVGVTAVRNNDEGRLCLDRWREQCLTECVMDPLAGKCGDQHYLDEWPELYGGLVISANPGIGVAPWNIAKRRVGRDERGVTVDGKPLIFYHYHALRLLKPRFGIKPALLGLGYFFSRDVVGAIYRPYVRELWRALSHLGGAKSPIMSDLQTVGEVGDPTTNQHLILTVGNVLVAAERNSRLVRLLFVSGLRAVVGGWGVRTRLIRLLNGAGLVR